MLLQIAPNKTLVWYWSSWFWAPSWGVYKSMFFWVNWYPFSDTSPSGYLSRLKYPKINVFSVTPNWQKSVHNLWGLYHVVTHPVNHQTRGSNRPHVPVQRLQRLSRPHRPASWDHPARHPRPIGGLSGWPEAWWNAWYPVAAAPVDDPMGCNPLNKTPKLTQNRPQNELSNSMISWESVPQKHLPTWGPWVRDKS